MNLVENGIKKILDIKRVITKYNMYFEVTYIDWYGHEGNRQFSRIDNIENQVWLE